MTGSRRSSMQPPPIGARPSRAMIAWSTCSASWLLSTVAVWTGEKKTNLGLITSVFLQTKDKIVRTFVSVKLAYTSTGSYAPHSRSRLRSRRFRPRHLREAPRRRPPPALHHPGARRHRRERPRAEDPRRHDRRPQGELVLREVVRRAAARRRLSGRLPVQAVHRRGDPASRRERHAARGGQGPRVAAGARRALRRHHHRAPAPPHLRRARLHHPAPVAVPA